jgi:uncharacterized protein YbjT (DUF2867 family)
MLELPTLPPSRRILVTGGTGYIGRALIPLLLDRGHEVRAIVRPASLDKLPAGAVPVRADPLQPESIIPPLRGCDTVVHLIGVAKPSPAKARQFRDVDLASIRAMTHAIAAVDSGPHLVYLSVAQPASVMKAYLAVRAEGEALIRALNIPATFVRPWYVLGPGHRWPYLLTPVYALLRAIPATRNSATRLGLVTLSQMIAALVHAVENPPTDVRIVDVPAIRAAVRKS